MWESDIERTHVDREGKKPIDVPTQVPDRNENFESASPHLSATPQKFLSEDT